MLWWTLLQDPLCHLLYLTHSQTSHVLPPLGASLVSTDIFFHTSCVIHQAQLGPTLQTGLPCLHCIILQHPPPPASSSILLLANPQLHTRTSNLTFPPRPINLHTPSWNRKNPVYLSSPLCPFVYILAKQHSNLQIRGIAASSSPQPCSFSNRPKTLYGDKESLHAQMSENINNTKDEDSIFPPELTSSIERLTYGPQDTEIQRTVINHLEKLKEFQEDTNNSVRSRKSLRRINT